MERLNEYFGESTYGEGKSTVMTTVKNLFKQDRDWTCSIASLRTIMSGYYPDSDVLSEDEFINLYGLKKGPYNSLDLHDAGILNSIPHQAGYSIPAPSTNQAVFLTSLMEDYNVMIECMVNVAHWIVLLGYVKLGNLEQDMFIYYDPYYHRINTIVADELISMWYDIGKHPLQRDYIAIPKVERRL